MTNDPPSSILVYGTLRRGGSNHFRMEGADFVASASVRGTLYKVGWYPGLVLDPQGNAITGDVFSVSSDHLTALDEYEGPEYHRVSTTALTSDGRTIDVDVWEWILPVDGLQPIPSGDWLQATAGE